MNIWYLNHYATPPDYGVPGRPYHLAKSLEKCGHKVTVVCAENHHLRSKSAPAKDLNACQNYVGVDYIHVQTRSYEGNGLGRLLNMCDFARSVARLEHKVTTGLIPCPKILIPSCVHPLVFPAARKLAKKFGAKVIFEVRDIWPLSLIELSRLHKWHPFVLWLNRVERQAYQQADAVVSLLPKALDHMRPLGLDPARFHYIPNGVSLAEWSAPSAPLPREHYEVFQDLKKRNKLIVIYAGSHGEPNALDQIFDLARLNRDIDVPYHFVLIGDGVEKEKLIERAEHEKIKFVTFLPKVSKEQIATAIKLSDVCFIGWQKKNIYRFGISPNKIGDYFMCEKPVLHAVFAGNDPVKEADAGISIEPYNPGQLDAALEKLINASPEERSVMGGKGRRYAIENLDWQILGKKYAEICESL